MLALQIGLRSLAIRVRALDIGLRTSALCLDRLLEFLTRLRRRVRHRLLRGVFWWYLLPVAISSAGRVSGGTAARMTVGLRGASNAKARRDLGWEPRYATWREGFPQALG